VSDPDSRALIRLLHLASPSLPVGAYSYSQGLESAIDAGIVSDESGALAWIRDGLLFSVARCEAPAFLRLFDAWDRSDRDAVDAWSAWFVASRDSAEFRAETVQMGYSLARLLADRFPGDSRVGWLPAGVSATPMPYPAVMAAACVLLETPCDASLTAYLFAWAENQVLAALKGVPLGQAAGQRMLFSLETALLEAAELARALPDESLANWAPGLTLLSMRHETQYSRIFRS
jgi:urease accessory protein